MPEYRRMPPTEAEIAYANKVLALLAGGYTVRTDQDCDGSVLVYAAYAGPARSATDAHPRVYLTPYSIERADDRLPDDPVAWTVARAVVSGGTYMDPPDVDVVDAGGAPSPWPVAVHSLAQCILNTSIDDLDEALREQEAARIEAEPPVPSREEYAVLGRMGHRDGLGFSSCPFDDPEAVAAWEEGWTLAAREETARREAEAAARRPM